MPMNYESNYTRWKNRTGRLLLKIFQSCISCNPLNPVNLKIWRLPACLPKMGDGLPSEGLDCYFGLWRQIDGFGQICHQ